MPVFNTLGGAAFPCSPNTPAGRSSAGIKLASGDQCGTNGAFSLLDDWAAPPVFGKDWPLGAVALPEHAARIAAAAATQNMRVEFCMSQPQTNVRRFHPGTPHRGSENFFTAPIRPLSFRNCAGFH